MNPDDWLVLTIALVAAVAAGWSFAGLILMATVKVCGL